MRYLLQEARETTEPHDQAQAVEQALTTELRKRLVAYSYRLVCQATWPGETDLHELAMDLVSEAVCKAITLERKWNREKTAGVVDFLFSAVNSEFKNRLKNHRNRSTLDSLDEQEEVVASTDAPIHERLEADEFFLGLMDALDGDEVCTKMLDLFEQGFTRAEVIQTLGLPASEIDAAKKRLQRKTTEFLDARRREASTT